MPFRFFKGREQFLLCADRGAECGVFRLKFPRNGIRLRDAGGGQLPAVEPLRQPHTLYEPCVAGGKAQENGILVYDLIRCGRIVERHEFLPEHIRAAILPPEGSLHEAQHCDVDENRSVIGTGEEQSVGQEIEPLADGGDRHLTCTPRPYVSDEEQNPPCEQQEDEERTDGQEDVEQRKGEHARRREQSAAPRRPPHREEPCADGGRPRKYTFVE